MLDTVVPLHDAASWGLPEPSIMMRPKGAKWSADTGGVGGRSPPTQLTERPPKRSAGRALCVCWLILISRSRGESRLGGINRIAAKKTASRHQPQERQHEGRTQTNNRKHNGQSYHRDTEKALGRFRSLTPRYARCRTPNLTNRVRVGTAPGRCSKEGLIGGVARKNDPPRATI